MAVFLDLLLVLAQSTHPSGIGDLPFEKMTTLAVATIVLVAIILYFVYKICVRICENKRD